MTIIKPEQINEVGEYLVSQLKEGRSLEFALATTQRVYGDQDQPAPIDPHPKPYVAPTHGQVHDRELEADIQQAISQKFAQETHESIQNLQRRAYRGPGAARRAQAERDDLRDRMEQKLDQEAQDIAVRDVVFEWAAGLPDGRFVALLEATGLTGYLQATPEETVSLAKEVLARVRRD